MGYIFSLDEANRVKKSFYNVMEDFPSIGLEDIAMVFDNPIDYATLSHERMIFSDGSKKDMGVLYVGFGVTKFDCDKQEAIMAHELAHYRKFSSMCDKKLISNSKWAEEFHDLAKFSSIPNYLTPKEQKRFDKLKGWYYLREMIADSEASELGYGYPLLDVLKYFRKDEERPMLKESLDIRIMNLEECLK